MGKKVYVNFNNPIFDTLLEDYMMKNSYLLNSDSKKKAYKKLEKKVKVDKQPLTKTEYLFAQQIKQDLEEERKEAQFKKLADQYEAELQRQKKLQSLPHDKQVLYAQWKKKGVDKLDELVEWDNLDKKKLNPNEGSWRDKLEAYSDENIFWNKAGDFSAINPLSYGKHLMYGVAELVTDKLDGVLNTFWRDNLISEKRKKNLIDIIEI